MPIVEVHLIEGYDGESKGRLGRALTDAVRTVVPAPPEAITVLMHEIAPDGYMRGGVRRTPAPALPDPVVLVRAYLDAMEARDLGAAQSCLGTGFQMVFPGRATFSDPADLVAWAASRYRSVSKSFDGFEVASGETSTIVYCRGTLAGVWPDGTAFEGIRFVDRFEVQAGKIMRQEVWNDIAEIRAGL